MTIKDALETGAKKLQSKNISCARLDAEVLLGFVLKKPREYLLAHSEKILKASEQELCSTLISRRAKYEPVAYLIGYKEFYGLKIKVDKNTLIPRPETELLVDEIIGLEASCDPLRPILDIGTGSGSIALALAKNLPKAQIWATDAFPDALRLARINAKALKLKIKPIYSNLLNDVKSKIIDGAIIVANLPYLDKQDIADFPDEIKHGLKFEPQSALYAKKRGTALYEILFDQINKSKTKPYAIICEIGSQNWRDFLRLAKRSFPTASIEVKKDYAGRQRILRIVMRNR